MRIKATDLCEGNVLPGIGTVVEVHVFEQPVAVLGKTNWPQIEGLKGGLLYAALSSYAGTECYDMVPSTVQVMLGRDGVRHYDPSDMVEVAGEPQELAAAA